MTTTPTTRSRHSFSARFAMISTVSLGLLAGPVAMAGPATATNDHSRKAECTVTALDPHAVRHHGRDAVGNDHRRGDRKSVRVAFPFRIHCDKDALVRYHQKMFQEHRWDTEEIGRVRDSVWVSGHEDKIVNVERVTADRHEKKVTVFHTVKIRVQDRDGGDHRNGSSDFDRSDTVTIWISNNHR